MEWPFALLCDHKIKIYPTLVCISHTKSSQFTAGNSYWCWQIPEKDFHLGPL